MSQGLEENISDLQDIYMKMGWLGVEGQKKRREGKFSPLLHAVPFSALIFLLHE